MDSQRPEPSGAVKARGAQRSDRRSRLGLDGEHGSGTQDSKRRAPSRRPAPISWLLRGNAVKRKGFWGVFVENSNIFFLKAGLWLKLKCLVRIARGCGS